MHLFCYTSYFKDELEEKIRKLSSENEDTFSVKFLISGVSEENSNDQETALEYGLNAHSKFLIRVNEKSAAGEVPQVVDILKNALAEDAVIVLWENEKLIY